MTIEKKCSTCHYRSPLNCPRTCSQMWEYWTERKKEVKIAPVETPKRLGKEISIYEIRKVGRNFCQTEGSKHYKGDATIIEPIEYAIANGTFEDWAIANVVKYITRFKNTRNLNDLKKASDYAQIMCGVELIKRGE